MPDKKEQKKLSPDSVDDATDKKYTDEAAMAALADMGDDEVIDESGEKKEPEEKQLYEFVDEVVEEPEEKKEEDKKVIEDKAQPLDKNEPDVKEVIAQKDAKIAELTEKVRLLEQQASKFGNVQNTIKELGFESMNQAELVDTMKQLKSAAFDFMRNPVFLDVIDNFTSGKFKVEGDEPKSVSSYMPKGMEEDFDHYESMNDPRSDSWIAREKWELERDKKRRELDDLRNKVNSYKESNSNTNQSEFQKKYDASKKLMDETMKELETFARDEFDNGEDVFQDFKKRFNSLDKEMFKVAIAVIAKQLGKESKAMKKIKENNGKVFPESGTQRSIEEQTGLYEYNKEQEEEMAEMFTDWNKDPGVVR